MTLFSWSGGFPTLAAQCSNPLVDLKDEKLQMKLQPTQMVETEFSLQVDSVVRARKWFLSQHHNALDNSTMNRLLPVLTVVSWMLIESGMMWSTECAPYSSKPINATRKISQSVTRMTTAPSTTLIPTVTPNQVQSAFQTKTLDGIHLNHSRIMNSIHPEGIVNRPTPNVDEKRNNSSITDRKGDAVNDVMGFLQRFGYLEDRQETSSEALIRGEAVIEAIKTMQRFGGLSPSGQMDNQTLELLSSPRCGNKDVELDAERNDHRRRKRFVIGAPGWNKRRITYFLANWTPKIGDETTTLIQLERAFKVWSDYAHLKFVRVPTPDADIVIMFGRGYHGDRYPFDGPGYTLAHAYYPYEFANFGGDVHFDEDEPWAINPQDGEPGIDFFTVATHELGHSLGLAHSPVPGSIMFPYYKGSQPNLHLDYDDILAMYQLYISRQVHDDRNEDEGETITTEKTTTTTSTSTTTTPRTSTTTSRSTRATKSTTPYYEEDENDIDDSGSRESSTTKSSVTINYDGDYETVDDHRRKFNTTNEDRLALPDICQGQFDAVSVLRNELFFFKNQYVWRLRQRSVIDYGYPTHFRHLFRELPSSLSKIDALYERPNGYIVFFSGPRYWVFDGDRMVEENSPLDRLGLPDGLDQLDAAFVWGKNKKTYFFRKNLYWRYDDVKGRMDSGYPHDLSRWRGVPSDIDAAMQSTDGKTYFFKNKLFWGFDDAIIRTELRYPLKASPYWLGCPE